MKSEFESSEPVIGKGDNLSDTYVLPAVYPFSLLGKKFKYLITSEHQLRFSNERKDMYPFVQELIENVEIVSTKPFQIKGELVQYECLFFRTYGKEAEKFLNVKKSLFFKIPYVKSGWRRLKEVLPVSLTYQKFSSVAFMNENDLERLEIVVNL